jgi:hypothetical protein
VSVGAEALWVKKMCVRLRQQKHRNHGKTTGGEVARFAASTSGVEREMYVSSI